MTKRVFRYFFDFTDSQEKWLNEMAAKGWRLIKCSQLSYDFESCGPGEHDYAVEFVAHKSYSKSKDYKAFLESLGYKTLYKAINIGIFIGKVEWRPWGDGAGQIATAPGSFQKELIIVEKKNNGKPFELHSDLTDSLLIYSKIRTAYTFKAVNMLAFAVMFLVFAIWQIVDDMFFGAVFYFLGAIPCTVLGILWLIPALRTSQKVRKLKADAETCEYEAKPLKKRILEIAIVTTVFILLGVGLFGAIHLSGGLSVGSYTARWKSETSLANHWNVSYGYLNGYRQRTISLIEGRHTFTIEIETKSGKINLSITGQDGTEYYKGLELQTSTFEIQMDITAKDKITLRIDASEHSGGYKIKWE